MTTAGVGLVVVLLGHAVQGFECAGWACPVEDGDSGEFRPSESQRLGPPGVVARHVACAAHQSGPECQGDSGATAEHGDQDRVFTVNGFSKIFGGRVSWRRRWPALEEPANGVTPDQGGST